MKTPLTGTEFYSHLKPEIDKQLADQPDSSILAEGKVELELMERDSNVRVTQFIRLLFKIDGEIETYSTLDLRMTQPSTGYYSRIKREEVQRARVNRSEFRVASGNFPQRLDGTFNYANLANHMIKELAFKAVAFRMRTKAANGVALASAARDTIYRQMDIGETSRLLVPAPSGKLRVNLPHLTESQARKHHQNLTGNIMAKETQLPPVTLLAKDEVDALMKQLTDLLKDKGVNYILLVQGASQTSLSTTCEAMPSMPMFNLMTLAVGLYGGHVDAEEFNVLQALCNSIDFKIRLTPWYHPC